MPRIVCLSDTHNRMPSDRLVVPDGDILVHSGDLTMMGKEKELLQANAWFGSLPHRHKVFCAGNHDWLFQEDPEKARALMANAVWLQDQEVTIEGLRIYGAAWQPTFFDWAFNLDRGAPIREKWNLIPPGIDVLLTHGPAYGYGDWVQNRWSPNGKRVGCEDLLDAIIRTKPALHVSGHIHTGWGEYAGHGTIFVNASTCNEEYLPVNPPIVIDL